MATFSAKFSQYNLFLSEKFRSGEASKKEKFEVIFFEEKQNVFWQCIVQFEIRQQRAFIFGTKSSYALAVDLFLHRGRGIRY